MKTIQAPPDFWTVCDPNGNLIHTHLALKPEDAIEDFLSTESTGNWIYNVGRVSRGQSKRVMQSWELFEAEGYSVEKVTLALKHDA